MADTFTETTTASWFSRIGGAFKGILVGLILVVIAFPLLWWNEGRAIDRTHTLEAGRRAVVAIDAARVDPAQEGQLIHLAGVATTKDVLSDAVFDVSLAAIKLRRTVEMYQWTQEQHSTTTKHVGGSETTETTYSYKKVWSDRWIDSSGFKYPADHANPASMPYGSQTEQAEHVTLGAFHLDPVFVSQISDFKPYPIMRKGAVPEGFEPNGGGYYRGAPASPAIGDLRVSFSVVAPTAVSLIGRQQGRGVETARFVKGSIALLELGQVDAPTMFQHAETANRILTWAMRVGGLLLMWLGLGLLLAPLKVLADVVPMIGSLVGAGTGLIAGIVAFALSFLTIAVAWIFYRPILAGALIVAAALFLAFGLFRIKGSARRAERQAAEMPG